MSDTNEQFPTLDTLDEFHRFLWYSDPGMGKTTDIMDAARYGRVVVIDSENGLKARALRRHGIPVENIEPRKAMTFDAIKALHQELLERLMEDPASIFAVAWDTTSKGADSLLGDISAESAAKSERKARKTHNDDPDAIKVETDIWQDDYGTLANQMRKLIRLYHGLPCHLLLSAHQRKNKDDDGSLSIGPALTPGVAAALVGYMDVIIHCRVETWEGDEEEFSGLCRPRGIITAKDRFGMLPPVLIDPTFTRVVDYLDGKLDRETDPKQMLARRRREAASAAQEKSKGPEAESNGESATEDKEEATESKA